MSNTNNATMAASTASIATTASSVNIEQKPSYVLSTHCCQTCRALDEEECWPRRVGKRAGSATLATDGHHSQ